MADPQGNVTEPTLREAFGAVDSLLRFIERDYPLRDDEVRDSLAPWKGLRQRVLKAHPNWGGEEGGVQPAKGPAPLTKEQALNYLRAGGVMCPFCRSQDIEGEAVEIDSGGAHQKMGCLKCGRVWHDGYVLDSVWDGLEETEFIRVPDAGREQRGQ